MSVAEMERHFYELKGKLDVGALSEEEFKREIEKLRFQDAQNRWWMIGAQSGKWYMYDGVRWLPATPPEAPPPPVAPIPEPTPAAITPPPQPTPSVAQPTEKKRAPLPIAPRPAPPAPLAPLAERKRRRPAPVSVSLPTQLPVRGPILIGCAGLAAIFLVILFWVAVENLVPGRPISTAFRFFTGGLTSPAATRTPTRSPAQPTASGNGISQLVTAGDEFVLQSQFDPAIAQYQAAAQLTQTSPVPLSHWSRALAFRGQLQEALAKAQQAVQRAPNDAEAQAQLARVQSWLGQTNDAITTGTKAVQLEPQSWNAHAFLAEIYLSAGRKADAQVQAQMALQLGPQSAEAHRAQAWLLTLSGQKDAALAEWKQTVTLEPNLSFRHFELGEVYRVFFKDGSNAAAEYRRAITLYGAFIPAYNRLGMALLDANQPQQAIPQFQRALTLDPNNASNYAFLGVAFGMANQCSQGIPYLEQALRMDANNPIAANGLGQCQNGRAVTDPTPIVQIGPIPPPTIAP